MNITSGPLAAPQRGVFYGPEGVGKTTLAASLPSPVFIDLESGTKSYDVDRTPVPATWDELFDIVEQLGKTDYQTVVIDTADAAERLGAAKVLEENKNWKSISAPDYGRGYLALADKWQQFLEKLTELSRRKHVVLIAHAASERFTLPGQLGQFDRYQLKLTKIPGQIARSMAPMTKEWADCVLFINYVTLTTKEDGTKRVVGIGGKERIIYTEHCDSYDAKHRHGLAEELPCAYASIATVFPPLSTVKQSSTVAPTAEESSVVRPTINDSLTTAEPHPLAWFADYEQPINAKLLEKGKIKAGQTWRDLDEASVAQLKGYAKAKLARFWNFELKDGDK